MRRIGSFALTALAACTAARAQNVYMNPHWLIDVSDAGYSDIILYTDGAFPAESIHEFVSGEWSAAIGYDGIQNRLVPPEALRARGASAITIPDIRWLRCDIKTIQLLPNVWAKQAAVERGAVDALMIRDGVVTEGSHANVIGVLDGTIRTHPTNHLILPGITRAIVLDMARGFGIPVSEEPIAEGDIGRLDELFLAGTTTDVMPIVRVNDQPVAGGVPGPITLRLLNAFRAHLDASCAAAHASP